jgi:myo-inositol 2-dehydrogenase/D-chiro-inositol 1-dehydrogenase
MKSITKHQTNISRRQFAKVGGIATVGTLLSTSSVWASNNNTLKVGLIGCGGRGTSAAEQALNADENVVLSAMADAFSDRLEESLQKLSGKFGQKVQVSNNKFVGLDAYQKLIESDVDVVLLAAPPYFRPDHLEAAVDAGKHIFCEKPFAVDAPGLRRVMHTARKAKEKSLSLVSGFCWRYHIPKRETFSRVIDGRIGDVFSTVATYNTGELWYKPKESGWSDMEYKLRNWLYYNWLSGDHIIEQAIHSIDMMSWALGDVAPVKITGSGGRQKRTDKKFGNIYDHFAIVYEYANGSKATLFCRQQDGTSRSYAVELFGDQGRCVVDCRTGLHEITGENPWRYDDETKFTDENAYKKAKVTNMYQQEHDELFASIRAGKPINDGEWMTRSNLLALAGRMAAYTGKTISYEEALSSIEVLGPEEMTWKTQYDVPIAIPGITKLI